MDKHRGITKRAVRMLGRHRDDIKEAYIEAYLNETGYSIDMCELVEVTQYVEGRIEMTWYMRKRKDG